MRLPRAAAFVVSQQAGYMTGTMVRVDGGIVAVVVATVISSPHEFRRLIRSGRFEGLTTGHVPGHVQANLAVGPRICRGGLRGVLPGERDGLPSARRRRSRRSSPGEPRRRHRRPIRPAGLPRLSPRPSQRDSRRHFLGLAGRSCRRGDRLLVLDGGRAGARGRAVAACRAQHPGAVVPDQSAERAGWALRRSAGGLDAAVCAGGRSRSSGRSQAASRAYMARHSMRVIRALWASPT